MDKGEYIPGPLAAIAFGVLLGFTIVSAAVFTLAVTSPTLAKCCVCCVINQEIEALKSKLQNEQR